jgi:hypothetical protein
MKVEFSRQMFEKHSNIKFHENPFSERRVVPCGRTDYSRFSQFCQTELKGTDKEMERSPTDQAKWRNIPNCPLLPTQDFVSLPEHRDFIP